MNKPIKLAVIIGGVFLLNACSCDMQWWDLTCKPPMGGYDSYREKYETYEAMRERKIVPGLGGALYRSW